MWLLNLCACAIASAQTNNFLRIRRLTFQLWEPVADRSYHWNGDDQATATTHPMWFDDIQRQRERVRGRVARASIWFIHFFSLTWIDVLHLIRQRHAFVYWFMIYKMVYIVPTPSNEMGKQRKNNTTHTANTQRQLDGTYIIYSFLLLSKIQKYVLCCVYFACNLLLCTGTWPWHQFYWLKTKTNRTLKACETHTHAQHR